MTMTTLWWMEIQRTELIKLFGVSCHVIHMEITSHQMFHSGLFKVFILFFCSLVCYLSPFKECSYFLFDIKVPLRYPSSEKILFGSWCRVKHIRTVSPGPDLRRIHFFRLVLRKMLWGGWSLFSNFLSFIISLSPNTPVPASCRTPALLSGLLPRGAGVQS